MKNLETTFDKIAFLTIAFLMLTLTAYCWLTFGTPDFFYTH